MNKSGQFGIGALLLVSLSTAITAQTLPAPVPPAPNPVEADGTVNVPPYQLPPSIYLSPEAKASMPREARDFGGGGGIGGLIKSGRIPMIRAAMRKAAEAKFEALKGQYQISIEAVTLGGISGYWVRPEKGVKDAALIFLSGGAFAMADTASGVVAAAPIVGRSGIAAFVSDYRQAPEAKFPAASEDLAAVYRALTRTIKPGKIGILGMSAGGLLTAQGIAWFQKEKLPRPGAAGILCATADARWAGDSWYWHKPFQGLKSPPELMESTYYGGYSLTDPLMSPMESDAVLAQFPPTLLVSAMRAGEVSSTVDTHRRLVRNRVDAKLHLWDGLNHCFFGDQSLPESREATDVIARFFREKLGLKSVK